MKTYKHLYPQICGFENLYLAYLLAKKGKSGKAPVASFMRKREDEIFALQNELQNKTYTPGAYHSFYVHDPKKRLVSAAPFRDRVVHHALCNVIEPIYESRFVDDSYANRIGKGTHGAIDRAQQFARRYPYVLQCDVRQFFPSIDHEILYGILSHHIADKDARWLIERILESGRGVLAEEYEMKYFTGDTLFAANRPRGLPIGNLTSQFWANIYLNELDQFVKREVKCKAYIRYVDDFVLFADDTKTLLNWKAQIIQKLAGFRQSLHEDRAEVFPTHTGIPFLGFRIYPEHRLVKSRKVIHYRRKLKRVLLQYAEGKVPASKIGENIKGWINHVRFGDTWGLRRAVLGRVVL